MKKILFSMALSVAVMTGIATQADARITLEFPVWELKHTDSNFATTNIFCSSDIADAVTLAFYSNTYANFYSTTQSWTTNGGYYTFLGAADTAFVAAVAALDSADGSPLGGVVFGPVRAIFKNSSRGNLNMVSVSTSGSVVSNKAYGQDPLAQAFNAAAVEVTGGNNSGCFVDVILTSSGLAFSVPENSNAKQNPANN